MRTLGEGMKRPTKPTMSLPFVEGAARVGDGFFASADFPLFEGVAPRTLPVEGATRAPIIAKVGEGMRALSGGIKEGASGWRKVKL